MVFDVSRLIYARDYTKINEVYRDHNIPADLGLVIGAITESQKLIDHALESEQKGGQINMCNALEELRQEGGEETYHNKEWFLALEKSYAKRGITFMEEVLNPEKTSYQLAQEAMELPLSKAFDQIPIFFDTTEEDS